MWSGQCSSSLSWMKLRESEPESEDIYNEMDVTSFVLDEEKEEEEPPTCTQNATRRSAQRM